MDLHELKKSQIREAIGFDPRKFGNALSFIDFANVNHWYDGETADLEGGRLEDGTTVEIDLVKLYDFTRILGDDARFYYGLDTEKGGSLAFLKAAEHVFGKYRVFTKPIQQIRHDLTEADSITNTRLVHAGPDGGYVFIPKCNFDIEIAVDAMRLIDRYDTVCLFSGDADFAALLRYLKGKGKRIVLVKGGHITKALGELADLKVNAGAIRSHIAYIKRKPGQGPGSRR